MFVFYILVTESLFNTDAIKADLQLMVDQIGSDPTEQLCESECHTIVQHTVIDTGCPLFCHSLVSVIISYQSPLFFII